jgi:hypothetical protein
MNSSEAVASALVNFSAVSFVLLLGTATFIPMVYELTLLRKDTPIDLLSRYPYRLISRLGETGSICTLMGTSLIFIAIGLLSLAYLILKDELVLTSALYLSFVVEVILCLYVAVILICALPYKKKEFEQIKDYGSASYEDRDIKK